MSFKATETFATQPPSKYPGKWRVYCGCGCGVWFYAVRKMGRKPMFVNQEHYLRARNAKRKARGWR
jgi:hypothetical protein